MFLSGKNDHDLKRGGGDLLQKILCPSMFSLLSIPCVVIDVMLLVLYLPFAFMCC
jgi:hypothetical protein